jgi:8-oxo-dGTP pyrophosphatase MutT (NUDIX family)
MKLQVGVKALIRNKQGLYLFLQRAKTLPTGEMDAWDIPGGRLAADEDITLEQALKREILEETGMPLTGTPVLLTAQDILNKSADLHVIRLTYSVTATGTPHLSEEHQAFAWLSFQEARKLQTDPYLKQLLLTQTA